MSNLVEFKHKGILINCTNSYESGARDSLYQAVRFAWKIKKERAQEYLLVFARVGTQICDVFEVEKWLDATPENFLEFAEEFDKSEDGLAGRIAFKGKLADFETRLAYIGKEIPKEYRSGMAPCRYIDPATGENEEVAE